MKRIFTYWYDCDKYTMPAYLQMCIHTWYESIPDVEVIIINRENISVWLEDAFDIKLFKRLSAEMQSFFAKIALIEKYGGVYLDVDTIVTDDIFKSRFNKEIDRSKVNIFGCYNADTNNPPEFHLGVLACFEPGNNMLKACLKAMNKKLSELPSEGENEIACDSFNINTIIAEVANDFAQEDFWDTHFQILDKYATGNILEGLYFKNETEEEGYGKLYFYPNDIFFKELLSKIKIGIVSLHDSWTQREYRNFSTDEVIKDSCMLSIIFKTVLMERIDGLKEIKTNQVYAKKIISKEKLDVYKKLIKKSHLNIPRFFNITCEDNNISVIEEVFDGVSFNELTLNKTINENVFLDLIYQLCDAIEFLHKFKPPIVYNNVNAENIIVGESNLLKLNNFDCANINGDILMDIKSVVEIINILPYKFAKVYAAAVKAQEEDFDNIDQVRTLIANTAVSIRKKRRMKRVAIISFTLILSRLLMRIFRGFL